jgi:hypothetical protein
MLLHFEQLHPGALDHARQDCRRQAVPGRHGHPHVGKRAGLVMALEERREL